MVVQEQQKSLGQIIAKAWSDPSFKERLKKEPNTVLNEMEIEIPEGVEIQVVENTATKMYLTLPVAPSLNAVTDEEITAFNAYPDPRTPRTGCCCLPPGAPTLCKQSTV